MKNKLFSSNSKVRAAIARAERTIAKNVVLMEASYSGTERDSYFVSAVISPVLGAVYGPDPDIFKYDRWKHYKLFHVVGNKLTAIKLESRGY